MKNKKFLLLLCMMLVISILSGGCSLALPGEAEEPEVRPDRLTGVFVTTQPLSLQAGEGYGFYERGADGQDRYYAKLVSQTRDDGHETADFIFEGLSGIRFFSARVYGGDETQSYTSSFIDDGPSGVHISLGGDTAVALEGTIYALPDTGHRIYYPNPVYQGTDGRVYTSPAMGLSMSGPDSEGIPLTSTLNEKHEITEDGESTVYESDVKLGFGVMFRPEKIIVFEMGAESEILKRTEYVPGTLPDSLAPSGRTEFLIIETQKTNPEGGSVSTRELAGRDSTDFTTFSARADGICTGKTTRIAWGE